MFRNKTLLLFDLDGTLIDSVPDLALAVNLTMRRLGHCVFEEKQVRGWVGNGAKTLVERALRAANSGEMPEEEALEEALEIFLESYAGNLGVKTDTYPHVPKVLERLRSEGFRLAIVTNKPHAFVKPILRNLDMEHLFEYIVGGDSLPRKKPDPAPLLHVCETLGIDRERCIMIGDSKNDILAAKAAGMHCIGLGYGYNYEEPIDAYGPDLVLQDFRALAEPFGVKCDAR